MSDFNPEKSQCGICESVIVSSYPGQFVRCKCGASFVDQTYHYSRYGGAVQSLPDNILKDLKALTGIGYEKDDVLAVLEDVAHFVFIPNEAVQREVYRQYETGVAGLGGSSPRELVEAGRGHKVIEYIEALKEGY
jgi:hypothetical protein